MLEYELVQLQYKRMNDTSNGKDGFSALHKQNMKHPMLQDIGLGVKKYGFKKI